GRGRRRTGYILALTSVLHGDGGSASTMPCLSGDTGPPQGERNDFRVFATHSSAFYGSVDMKPISLFPYSRPLRGLVRTLASMLALASVATAALAAGPKAYVGNFKDNTVSVIDTATRAVVATVPVVAGPHGMGVTPDGRR